MSGTTSLDHLTVSLRLTDSTGGSVGEVSAGGGAKVELIDGGRFGRFADVDLSHRGSPPCWSWAATGERGSAGRWSARSARGWRYGQAASAGWDGRTWWRPVPVITRVPQ